MRNVPWDVANNSYVDRFFFKKKFLKINKNKKKRKTVGDTYWD